MGLEVAGASGDNVAEQVIPAVVAAAVGRWAREVRGIMRGRPLPLKESTGHVSSSSSTTLPAAAWAGMGGDVGGGVRRSRVLRVVDASVTLAATFFSTVVTELFGGAGGLGAGWYTGSSSSSSYSSFSSFSSSCSSVSSSSSASSTNYPSSPSASSSTASSSVDGATGAEACSAVEEEAAEDQAEEEEAEVAEEEADTRPVISFSGCGFLYPYQLGVAQYVSEHFHADGGRVRCAAHSAGFAAAFTVAAGVPLSAHWEALQRARRHWGARCLGPFACSTRSWMAPYLRALEPHREELLEASRSGAIALGYTRMEWRRCRDGRVLRGRVTDKSRGGGGGVVGGGGGRDGAVGGWGGVGSSSGGVGGGGGSACGGGSIGGGGGVGGGGVGGGGGGGRGWAGSRLLVWWGVRLGAGTLFNPGGGGGGGGWVGGSGGGASGGVDSGCSGGNGGIGGSSGSGNGVGGGGRAPGWVGSRLLVWSLRVGAGLLWSLGVSTRHEVITNVDTLKELAYAVTLSQRILPFYRHPGRWKGGLAIDGCFSASYTVGGSIGGGGVKGVGGGGGGGGAGGGVGGGGWAGGGGTRGCQARVNPRRVVRVSPCLPGDISPATSPPWYAYVMPPAWEEWQGMVRAGYADAAAARGVLVAAGLQPRQAPVVAAQYETESNA